MTKPIRVVTRAGAVLVCGASLVACGSHGTSAGPSSPRPTTSPTANAQVPVQSAIPTTIPTPTITTSVPASQQTPPHVSAVGGSLQAAATAFVTGRENQVSWQQKTPTSWLDQVKPVLTASAYQTMKKAAASGDVGVAWQQAHSQGIATKVVVSKCVNNEESGINTATHKAVQCAVTDVPIDKTGKPIPTNKIPQFWNYSGSHNNVLLDMVQQGGKWFVNADWTGMAS